VTGGLSLSIRSFKSCTLSLSVNLSLPDRGLNLTLGKFNRELKIEPKESKPKPKEPEPKNLVPYSVPDIEEPK
jgi:hypothetical protein